MTGRPKCPRCGFCDLPKRRACVTHGLQFCRGGPGPSDPNWPESHVQTMTKGDDLMRNDIDNLMDELEAKWNAALGDEVDAYVRSGLLLVEAKAALDKNGLWIPFVEDRLGVHRRTAQKDMEIVKDPNIRRDIEDPVLRLRLPRSRRAKHALVGKTPEQYEALRNNGLIQSETSASDINAALAASHSVDPAPIPEKQFRVILADPPWDFTPRGEDGDGRSPDYRKLSMEEVAALGPEIDKVSAEDGALFLWIVSDRTVGEYEGIIRAWGFEPIGQQIVWVKDRIKKGYLLRNQHELCMVAIRGAPKRKDFGVSTVIEAPSTGRHSEKPDEIHEKIERLYPGPYLELFGRKDRPGWTVWGDDPALAINRKETGE